MTAPTGTAAEFDHNQTGTANAVPRSLTWLAVAIALAGVPSLLWSQAPWETWGGNVRITVQDGGMERAILLAISDLHDRLIAKSTELPPEAAAVLYANLWDLYVD